MLLEPNIVPIFASEQLAFLQNARVARLATCGSEHPHPMPHCVPVCFAYVEDHIWIAIDEKPKSGRPLRRLRNIEANPQVSLTIDHYEDDWTKLAYLIVEGKAVVGCLSDVAIGALRGRYQQYRQMRLEQAIIIEPQRCVFWRS